MQETNFKVDQPHHLKQFESHSYYRTTHQRASGGTSIYVRDTYYTEVIDVTSSLEVTAVSVWCPNRLTICNVYIPPDRAIVEEDLTDLLSQLPPPYLLLGDFNAHHPLWGSEKASPAGKIIEKILNNNDITILNTGEATHISSFSGKTSSIDLSFSDPRSAAELAWQVLDSTHDSDHFPIILSTNRNLPPPQSHTCWNLRSVDWTAFSETADEAIRLLRLPEDINTCVSQFTSAIVESAQKHIPRKTHNPRLKQVPWWSKECEIAVCSSKRALNRFRRLRTQETLDHFKKQKAVARRIIKEAKRKSWREYVAGLSSNVQPGEVWNKIKGIKAINSVFRIPALKNKDNVLLTLPRDIASLIGRTLEETFSTENYNEDFKQAKVVEEATPLNFTYNSDDPINAPINMTELIAVLKRSKNSAPGPDDIPSLFIKNLTAGSLDYLLMIYNKVWTEHLFPSQWLNSTILPIYKQSKPKLNPASYRPISLTCTLCKLLEKVINNRLLWHLEYQQLLSPNQMGFRPRRSTTDSLVLFHTEITHAFARQQHLLAVFFDIEKAFDRTWRYGILKRMSEIKIGGHIMHFVKNFLQNRKYRVRVNNELSQEYIQENGVPQGSVISTTLFIIAMDTIISRIHRPVQIIMYADDVLIYCRGRNIDTIRQQIQETIYEMENWSESNGLLFSVTKTKSMLFSRSRTVPEYPSLKLYNSNIPAVTKHLFLGLTFDTRLNWVPHLTNLKAECLRRMNILKTLSHHHWGSQESLLLKIYRCLIRPKLDYGCMVYGSASKTSISKLNPIAHTAIRLAIGAFKSSPVESILREADELPLYLRRQHLSLKYAAKVSASVNSPVYTALFTNSNDSYFARHPKSPLPLSYRLKLINANCNFTATEQTMLANNPPWNKTTYNINESLLTVNKHCLPSETIRQHFFSQMTDYYKDHTAIYTDASKLQDATGCAIVTDDITLLFRLPATCSVFTAELYAVHKAYLLIEEHTSGKFIVCTDSMSSINLLNDMYSVNPLVTKIHETSQRIAAMGKTVVIMWVPSHCGIVGNELADEASRTATSLETVEPLQLHEDLQLQAHSFVKRSWQRHWDGCQTQKLYEIEPTVMSTTFHNTTRLTETLMRRLRIGHTSLTHGYLMTHENPPQCNRCDASLTVKHLLVSCPEYEAERREFNLQGGDISKVLNLSNVVNVKNFLLKINCLSKI